MAWIFVVAMIVMGACVVGGFRRKAVRLTRSAGMPNARPLITFRGGMWSLHGGGTRGDWARLDFFGWGIRLRGVLPLGPLLPVFEIRYEELKEAQLVTSRLRSGICFRSDSLSCPVIFESADGVKIVGRLTEHGVSINPAVEQLNRSPGE